MIRAADTAGRCADLDPERRRLNTAGCCVSRKATTGQRRLLVTALEFCDSLL